MSGVRVRARGWGWRHAGRSRPAVSGLDLDVAPGERVLLLGASGAGKSTLLHALAGVLGGDEEGERTGELTLDGVAPEAARGRAGLVLQDPDSQVVLARVGDDVAFACENLGVPRDEIWRRVREALDAVGLDVQADRPSSALSGGQTQRLALAGVLAMRPGLLLLDEPTANLDPDGVVQVRDAVAAACEREGITLIVVEHRVEVWADAVDRVVVLGPGEGVVADGRPGAVLSERGAELSASGVWVPGHAPVAGRPSRRTTPTEILLSARGLAVGRVPFARKEPLVAASGLDLEVGAGRALAVTGPNGAGKSTLALTLAGLLAPIDGALEASPAFSAGARGSRPIRWRSRDLLTRIGTVFQEPEHQFLTSSVRAELEVGPRALRLPEAETAARVDELLGRLRLDGLADANPFTLSGGEKRRLSVATVLATRPRLLVLDEPSFGQDAVTWRELVLLLRRLVDEGSGVVAVTHDRPLVEAVADEEYRLGTGEAVRA